MPYNIELTLLPSPKLLDRASFSEMFGYQDLPHNIAV
jgi:hypothetical protein